MKACILLSMNIVCLGNTLALLAKYRNFTDCQTGESDVAPVLSHNINEPSKYNFICLQKVDKHLRDLEQIVEVVAEHPTNLYHGCSRL